MRVRRGGKKLLVIEKNPACLKNRQRYQVLGAILRVWRGMLPIHPTDTEQAVQARAGVALANITSKVMSSSISKKECSVVALT